MGTPEAAPPPALGGAQRERLARLCALLAERNPFWRPRLERFDPAAADPLATIEPLSKAELVADQAANPPFGTNLSFGLERFTHFHQTSGTTGFPLKVLDTAADWEWWCAAFARTFAAAGIGPGDRVGLAFSFGPHIHFWASHAGLERVGAMAIPLGGMTSAQRLKTLAGAEATAIACTPSYALRLGEVAVSDRLEGALEGIERVICTGEPGASMAAMRERIESALGARCFDHAGLSEAGPFGYPCSSGAGIHLDGTEFINEVLDSAGAPARAGEAGELVVTPLGRSGSPVIRYRTGDIVTVAPGRCPEGHEDPWLPDGITGRTDDMVVIRGMNVYPSAIEQAVSALPGSGDFRLTFYTEPGAMDEVKVELELSDGGRARELQELLRVQLGLRVRVVPVHPGTLPRGDGKRGRRSVDARDRAPVR